ncbi:choline O-acetyltransferase isoform X1 [Ixodes scapularis]
MSDQWTEDAQESKSLTSTTFSKSGRSGRKLPDRTALTGHAVEGTLARTLPASRKGTVQKKPELVFKTVDKATIHEGFGMNTGMKNRLDANSLPPSALGQAEVIRSNGTSWALKSIQIRDSDYPTKIIRSQITRGKSTRNRRGKHSIGFRNVNQCSLQSLETCLLVVCLDRPLNLRRHYATIRRESFTLDWAAQAAHLLHGESNTPGEGNAANRCAPKRQSNNNHGPSQKKRAEVEDPPPNSPRDTYSASWNHSIVVSRDGVNGLIIEHSGSDGVTVLRFCEEFLDFVQEHSVCSSARRGSGDTSLYPVSRLSWDLNEDMLRAIQEASKSLGKLAEDVDLYVLTFQNYGKDFIKAQKISPDVFIQLALQLTYYKVHRKLVSTYESASLRKFHLGRVDNIRAATSEALTWIQAMCDAVPASEDDRIKFFQAAVNKGTEILTYTVNGEGPDNHLLGLREMARLHEKTVPLFEDKSYADFLRFRLSTSQLATEKSILVGYGPVVPDGYGCSYNICPAHVDFCVSSFFSSPETSSDFFALSLEGSLLQMRELCIKRAQKDAENNAVLPPTAS